MINDKGSMEKNSSIKSGAFFWDHISLMRTLVKKGDVIE